jgi:type IV pilus assembly protein PilC
VEFVCHFGTPDGRVLRETRVAPSESVLRDELVRQGFQVFTVEKRLGLPSFADTKSMWRRRSKLPAKTLLIFNQELAALLKAGLPLLQALNLMLERSREPVFHDILSQIRDRVTRGEELSQAFASFGNLFPPLYSATLKAGERTGELEVVIRRFIRYLKLVIDARKRVVSALVYPAVLICLSIALILVMTIFVVPQFRTFYDNLEIPLPFLTRFTIGLSVFLRSYFVWLLLGISAAVYLARRWSRSRAGGLAIDRLKLKIPILGGVLHRFSLSEFCRSLSTLLAGGMPLVPSLEISIAAISNRFVRSKVEPTVQKVREGRALHDALESTGVVLDLAVDMVKVGEATGSLDVMLSNVSDFFDEEVEVRMQRILSMLEPIMLVLMGGIVALILVSVYLPMFSALGNVR